MAAWPRLRALNQSRGMFFRNWWTFHHDRFVRSLETSFDTAAFMCVYSPTPLSWFHVITIINGSHQWWDERWKCITVKLYVKYGEWKWVERFRVLVNAGKLAITEGGFLWDTKNSFSSFPFHYYWKRVIAISNLTGFGLRQWLRSISDRGSVVLFKLVQSHTSRVITGALPILSWPMSINHFDSCRVRYLIIGSINLCMVEG